MNDDIFGGSDNSSDNEDYNQEDVATGGFIQDGGSDREEDEKDQQNADFLSDSEEEDDEDFSISVKRKRKEKRDQTSSSRKKKKPRRTQASLYDDKAEVADEDDEEEDDDYEGFDNDYDESERRSRYQKALGDEYDEEEKRAYREYDMRASQRKQIGNVAEVVEGLTERYRMSKERDRALGLMGRGGAGGGVWGREVSEGLLRKADKVKELREGGRAPEIDDPTLFMVPVKPGKAFDVITAVTRKMKVKAKEFIQNQKEAKLLRVADAIKVIEDKLEHESEFLSEEEKGELEEERKQWMKEEDRILRDSFQLADGTSSSSLHFYTPIYSIFVPSASNNYKAVYIETRSEPKMVDFLMGMNNLFLARRKQVRLNEMIPTLKVAAASMGHMMDRKTQKTNLVLQLKRGDYVRIKRGPAKYKGDLARVVDVFGGPNATNSSMYDEEDDEDIMEGGRHGRRQQQQQRSHMGASSSTIRVLIKYIPRIKMEEVEFKEDEDALIHGDGEEDDDDGTGSVYSTSQGRTTRSSSLRMREEKKLQALQQGGNLTTSSSGGEGSLSASGGGGHVSKRPSKALFNPYERNVAYSSMERKDIRGIHYDVVQGDYLNEDGFAYKEVNPSTYCVLGIDQVNPSMDEMTLFVQGEAMAKKKRKQLGYDLDEDEENDFDQDSQHGLLRRPSYDDSTIVDDEGKSKEHQDGSSGTSNTTHVSQIEQLARQELEHQMAASASLHAKRQALPPSERFHIGDKVQVVIPEMKGIKGRVIATDDEKSVVEIQLTHYPDNRPIQPSSSSGDASSLSDSLIRLDPNDLEIWVDIGEKIVFVGGMYDGHAGTVVAVTEGKEGSDDTGDSSSSSSSSSGKKVVVLADGTNTEMIEDIAFCHQPNLHLFSNSQVQSLEGYALYDMVKMSAFDSGMIIYVGTDHLDAINKNNKITRVVPGDLLGKEHAKSTANDHMHRIVRIGDKVKIIDKNIVGRYGIEEGIVKHIYQRVLFLHSPYYNKNSGILCVKANLTANTSAVSQASMYGGFDGANFKSPRPGGRSSNRKNNNNNNNNASETLVGKTVRISRGLHKGQLGRVKNESDESLLIELHSQLRTVSIPRSSIVEINSHKKTSNNQQQQMSSSSSTSSSSLQTSNVHASSSLGTSNDQQNQQEKDDENDFSLSSGSRTPYMSSQTPFASFESSERSGSQDDMMMNNDATATTNSNMMMTGGGMSGMSGMDTTGFDQMTAMNPFFDAMLSTASSEPFDDIGMNNQYLENPYSSSLSSSSSSSSSSHMNPVTSTPGNSPMGNAPTNFFGSVASSFSPSSTNQSPTLMNNTDLSPMQTNQTGMTDLTPMTPFDGQGSNRGLVTPMTPSGGFDGSSSSSSSSRRGSMQSSLSPALMKLSQALKGVIVNVMTETMSSLAVLLSVPPNLSSSLTPDTSLNIQDIEATHSGKFQLVGQPKMMMARYLTISAPSQKQKVVIPSDGNKVGKVKMIFDQEAVVVISDQDSETSSSSSSSSSEKKGKKVKKAYDVKDLFPIFEDIFFTASSSGSNYYGNNDALTTGSAWGDVSQSNHTMTGSAWGDTTSHTPSSTLGSAWGDVSNNNNSSSNTSSAWGTTTTTNTSNNNNNNTMMMMNDNNNNNNSTTAGSSAWGDDTSTASSSPWGNAPSAWS